MIYILPLADCSERAYVRGKSLSSYRRFASTCLRWLIVGIRVLTWIAVIVWTTLAIYFSNLPLPELRPGLRRSRAGGSGYRAGGACPRWYSRW
jgi:hypothetical protein